MMLVSPSATATALGRPGTHPSYFARTAYSDHLMGVAMAEYVRNVLHLKRAATISYGAGSGYSGPIEAAFVERFAALRGVITTRGRGRVRRARLPPDAGHDRSPD